MDIGLHLSHLHPQLVQLVPTDPAVSEQPSSSPIDPLQFPALFASSSSRTPPHYDHQAEFFDLGRFCGSNILYNVYALAMQPNFYALWITLCTQWIESPYSRFTLDAVVVTQDLHFQLPQRNLLYALLLNTAIPPYKLAAMMIKLISLNSELYCSDYPLFNSYTTRTNPDSSKSKHPSKHPESCLTPQILILELLLQQFKHYKLFLMKYLLLNRLDQSRDILDELSFSPPTPFSCIKRAYYPLPSTYQPTITTSSSSDTPPLPHSAHLAQSTPYHPFLDLAVEFTISPQDSIFSHYTAQQRRSKQQAQPDIPPPDLLHHHQEPQNPHTPLLVSPSLLSLGRIFPELETDPATLKITDDTLLIHFAPTHPTLTYQHPDSVSDGESHQSNQTRLSREPSPFYPQTAATSLRSYLQHSTTINYNATPPPTFVSPHMFYQSILDHSPLHQPPERSPFPFPPSLPKLQVLRSLDDDIPPNPFQPLSPLEDATSLSAPSKQSRHLIELQILYQIWTDLCHLFYPLVSLFFSPVNHLRQSFYTVHHQLRHYLHTRLFANELHAFLFAPFFHLFIHPTFFLPAQCPRPIAFPQQPSKRYVSPSRHQKPTINPAPVSFLVDQSILEAFERQDTNIVNLDPPSSTFTAIQITYAIFSNRFYSNSTALYLINQYYPHLHEHILTQQYELITTGFSTALHHFNPKSYSMHFFLPRLSLFQQSSAPSKLSSCPIPLDPKIIDVILHHCPAPPAYPLPPPPHRLHLHANNNNHNNINPQHAPPQPDAPQFSELSGRPQDFLDELALINHIIHSCSASHLNDRTVHDNNGITLFTHLIARSQHKLSHHQLSQNKLALCTLLAFLIHPDFDPQHHALVNQHHSISTATNPLLNEQRSKLPLPTLTLPLLPPAPLPVVSQAILSPDSATTSSDLFFQQHFTLPTYNYLEFAILLGLSYDVLSLIFHYLHPTSSDDNIMLHYFRYVPTLSQLLNTGQVTRMAQHSPSVNNFHPTPNITPDPVTTGQFPEPQRQQKASWPDAPSFSRLQLKYPLEHCSAVHTFDQHLRLRPPSNRLVHKSASAFSFSNIHSFHYTSIFSQLVREDEIALKSNPPKLVQRPSVDTQFGLLPTLPVFTMPKYSRSYIIGDSFTLPHQPPLHQRQHSAMQIPTNPGASPPKPHHHRPSSSCMSLPSPLNHTDFQPKPSSTPQIASSLDLRDSTFADETSSFDLDKPWDEPILPPDIILPRQNKAQDDSLNATTPTPVNHHLYSSESIQHADSQPHHQQLNDSKEIPLEPTNMPSPNATADIKLIDNPYLNNFNQQSTLLLPKGTPVWSLFRKKQTQLTKPFLPRTNLDVSTVSDESETSVSSSLPHSKYSPPVALPAQEQIHIPSTMLLTVLAEVDWVTQFWSVSSSPASTDVPVEERLADDQNLIVNEPRARNPRIPFPRRPNQLHPPRNYISLRTSLSLDQDKHLHDPFDCWEGVLLLIEWAIDEIIALTLHLSTQYPHLSYTLPFPDPTTTDPAATGSTDLVAQSSPIAPLRYSASVANSPYTQSDIPGTPIDLIMQPNQTRRRNQSYSNIPYLTASPSHSSSGSAVNTPLSGPITSSQLHNPHSQLPLLLLPPRQPSISLSASKLPSNPLPAPQSGSDFVDPLFPDLTTIPLPKTPLWCSPNGKDMEIILRIFYNFNPEESSLIFPGELPPQNAKPSSRQWKQIFPPQNSITEWNAEQFRKLVWGE